MNIKIAPAKYIIFETALGDVPIVFPGHVDHSAVANSLTQTFIGWKPVSAGMVDIDSVGMYCHSKSVSMQLSAREGDSNILERALST